MMNDNTVVNYHNGELKANSLGPSAADVQVGLTSADGEGKTSTLHIRGAMEQEHKKFKSNADNHKFCLYENGVRQIFFYDMLDDLEELKQWIAKGRTNFRLPDTQKRVKFTYHEDKEIKLHMNIEGVDVDKIPKQEVESSFMRRKVEVSKPGPIRRTAYFLTHGDKHIVAEVIYKAKLRHLIFSIGEEKFHGKGKKIDDPNQYPI